MHKRSPSNKENARAQDKQKNSGIPKFLLKTYEMLESGDYNEYVSWSSDGTAIVIKQATEFAERVLPDFFKHGNLASFVRQLNMYRFKKKKDTQYDHVYFHALFYRGNKNNLSQITRKGLDPSNPIVAQSTSDSSPVQKENEAEKPDLDQEMSSVMNENLDLKKRQEIMNSRLASMEERIAELQKTNEELLAQTQQHEKNEDDLKKILFTIASTIDPFLVQSAMASVQKENITIDEEFAKELKSLLPDIDTKCKGLSSIINLKEMIAGEYYSQGSTDYICFQPEEIRKDAYYINRLKNFSLKRFNSDELCFEDDSLENQQNAFDPLEMSMGAYHEKARDNCCNYWTDCLLSKQDAFNSLY